MASRCRTVGVWCRYSTLHDPRDESNFFTGGQFLQEENNHYGNSNENDTLHNNRINMKNRLSISHFGWKDAIYFYEIIQIVRRVNRPNNSLYFLVHTKPISVYLLSDSFVPGKHDIESDLLDEYKSHEPKIGVSILLHVSCSYHARNAILAGTRTRSRTQLSKTS